MTDPGLDAYLICATPRSGSTLLCGLLESSGIAGHPASYFNRKTVERYAAEWGVTLLGQGRIDEGFVSAALRAGRTPNGVFGGRVMAETLPELVDGLAVTRTGTATDMELLRAHLGRLRFVHLRRVDVVAQAVSWARSLQTHFWHPGEEVLPGGRPPRYDEDLIGRLVGIVQQGEETWTSWFAAQGIAPCEVTYEGLAADPPRTAREVLRHLVGDLASDAPLEVRHHRQADALNAEWIARFTAG